MLIRRRGADLSEIERLYRARFPVFLRATAAILRDADAARDAVQEAFARAVHGRRDFRGQGTLEAWLFQIVLNTARDNRRLADRRSEFEEIGSSAAWDGGYLDADQATLRLCLSELPERQRLILFLRYFADLDYETIGHVVGVRAGTVAATLHAARSALRSRFEEVHR